ncbi:MAG: hypothetical protein DRI98_11260, partial [Bacteroidetes bacterium]
AQLMLYNLNGQKILSYPVTSSDGNLLLPTGQINPGTYLYTMQSGQWHSDSKKLVIQ